MRTNRIEFAKFAVGLLLPLVEQRGVQLSLGHPSMESLELKINGLVVMRSQSILHEWSSREGLLLLDLWPAGGNKVLSVSTPPFKVVSFKPGDWMDLVTALAGQTSMAGNSWGSDPTTQRYSSHPAGEPRLDRRPAPKEIWHLVVPRADVEAGDVSSVLSYLKTIASGSATAWQMRGRVSISFDGYSGESRSIFTVPEVRRFVAKIHAARAVPTMVLPVMPSLRDRLSNRWCDPFLD